MASVKTEITLTSALLAAIDRAAKARGEKRSQFVTRVLQEAVQRHRDAEVEERLNRIFANSDIASELLREANELDAVGTDWSDERW